MQGENTIQASMDKSSKAQAMAEARLKNTEIRRMETAIRNRQVDANAAEQLGFSRNAEARQARAEERAITAAGNEPIGTVIKVAAGNQEKERQANLDREVAGSPETMEVLRQLTKFNFRVPKEDKAGMEEHINNLKISQEAKDGILSKLRY